MSEQVITAFLAALTRHITWNRLSQFTCSFHGGEPTLFGAARLRPFLQRIDAVASETQCEIDYALTTNGSLLDDEWVNLIKEFAIAVTVSIDGPPAIHDKRRVNLTGAATWEASVRGYLALCRKGIVPSIIAVCDPSSDPIAMLDHLAIDLGVRFCDVLIPDNNYSTPVQSIARYYIDLFDHWYDNYIDKGVEVRILNEFLRSALGLESRSESIGLAPLQVVCLNANGLLEPHDVLRIAGKEHSETTCNILNHEIADIEVDPLFRLVKETSVNLCSTCNACRYRIACGGGHITQRWSAERQYDNPSIYCADYISIFDHIINRLKNDIRVTRAGIEWDSERIALALGQGNAASIFAA